MTKKDRLYTEEQVTQLRQEARGCGWPALAVALFCLVTVATFSSSRYFNPTGSMDPLVWWFGGATLLSLAILLFGYWPKRRR